MDVGEILYTKFSVGAFHTGRKSLLFLCGLLQSML